MGTSSVPCSVILAYHGSQLGLRPLGCLAEELSFGTSPAHPFGLGIDRRDQDRRTDSSSRPVHEAVPNVGSSNRGWLPSFRRLLSHQLRYQGWLVLHH
jgi:hypothetical protein